MVTKFKCLYFIVFFIGVSLSQCNNDNDVNEALDDQSHYFFGSELSNLKGRDLASAYPDGSCDSRHFICYGDVNHLMIDFSAITPFDCCKSCLNNTNCKAWNHYYVNATNNTEYIVNEYPRCSLYSDFQNNSNHVYSGNCVMGVPYTKSNKRSNFVFYYPDTIRVDVLNAYGYPLQNTPNINKFMSENGSVSFWNHIAQHSQCSPSRTAMITGRYMHCLGHRTQTHLSQYWEPNYIRWLKDSGYYVLWLGKNDALSMDTFPLSVNEWSNQIGVAGGGHEYAYPNAGYYSFLYTESTAYGNDSQKNGDYKAIVTAQQFLKSNPPQPFMIFIPGKGGHPPYSAPQDYYNKYTPQQVQTARPLRAPYTPGKPNYYSKTKGIPYYRNLTTLDDSVFYKINSIYVGRMSYMDWLFGELYGSIKEFDASTGTTTGVFMSSDHGDFSGDYRFVEKWPGSMDDLLLKIPLFARIGGSKIGKGNTNIYMATQSFDVFETMLDVADIYTEFNRFGVSLRDQLVNGNDGDLNKYVYSEGGFYYFNELFPNGSDHVNSGPESNYWPRAEEEMSENGNGSPRCAMMKNSYFKLVFRPTGISEFYDLINDEMTLNNLYYDNSNQSLVNVRNQMLFNLTEWYVLTGDLTPILMDPRGMPPNNVPTN